MKHFIYNFIYYCKEQLKRFKIIYIIILYHPYIFNFDPFKNDCRKKAFFDIVCQASFTWKKTECTQLNRFARLTWTVFFVSKHVKIGLLDSDQKNLTLTTKTAPGGPLRLILEEVPWNRQQSLHYNSPYRLGPFKSFRGNSEGRKVDPFQYNFQKSIWKIA